MPPATLTPLPPSAHVPARQLDGPIAGGQEARFAPRFRTLPRRSPALGSLARGRVHRGRAARLAAAAAAAPPPQEGDDDDWEGAGPGWSFEEPTVYYFAVANAQSLACDGILLEEILRDAIVRADRARRPRDVWLVMEPAFLASHPNLAPLSARLQKPTAAVVTTNGEWMLTIVKPLLPQAVIGKFRAPTKYVTNPVQSLLNPEGAVIGGGAVWH